MSRPPKTAGAGPTANHPAPGSAALLYHFARLQLPTLALAAATVAGHLERTYTLSRDKNSGADWAGYLAGLHAADWLLAVGCLEGRTAAWELLFAARTGRGECLLVDALRARAARLYPRDEGRRESAVAEFWGHLLVSEAEGSIPVLARYDGQRPLVPWLIRVFQNRHLSQLRRHPVAGLPEDEAVLADPASGPGGDGPAAPDARWQEAFRLAAHETLAGLADGDTLLLGLRLRYRLSQREAAHLLGVHEGTVSRQTDRLRDRCLDRIGRRLVEEGWTGDDLSEYIRLEMGSLLLDDPRLGADRLAALLAARGKSPPAEPVEAAVPS